MPGTGRSPDARYPPLIKSVNAVPTSQLRAQKGSFARMLRHENTNIVYVRRQSQQATQSAVSGEPRYPAREPASFAAIRYDRPREASSMRGVLLAGGSNGARGVATPLWLG